MKKIFAAVSVMAALFTSCSVKVKANVEVEKSKEVEETYSIDTTLSSVIALPKVDITGSMTLMEALKNRKTGRAYTGAALSDRQISELLWAAGGVNREDGRLTSPTARNAQQIDIYVYTKRGVFLYKPVGHQLELVKEGNFIAKAGKQPFYEKAAVALTFVANYDKMEALNFDEKAMEFYGATDTGFASQNVYLYCAQENLGTVVCGMIDRDTIKEVISLKNGYPVLSQAIGVQE